jgi:AcrR family transcriptional regulator
MQYQKENVKNAILKAAKTEFIAKGYQGASLRNIAGQADVAVSNIYNYFNNKDEIFKEVLQPVLTKIEAGKKFLAETEFKELEASGEKLDLATHQKLLMKSGEFIDENRGLLKLLIFEAYGSSLENYKEELIDWYVNIWGQYVEQNRVEVDKFIFRNIAGIWYNALEEALRRDIRGARFKNLVREMTIFVFGGWNKLIDWKQGQE